MAAKTQVNLLLTVVGARKGRRARCQLHAYGSRLCGRQCGRHISKAAGLACFPPSSLPVCLVCPLTSFAGLLLGWNRQPLPSSLAHLPVTPTPTSTAGSQDTASLLNPGSVPAAGVCFSHASVCDTREPPSAKLLQSLRNLDFVELHKFLPAPLLRAATGTPTSCADGHSCHCPHTTAVEKGAKTVGDIYTWTMSFYRFTAAALVFHLGKNTEFMAYANTILQAYLQFEGDGWQVYDWAFQLQAGGKPERNWATIHLPLYAKTFTGQARHKNSCHYCCSLDHQSVQCP